MPHVDKKTGELVLRIVYDGPAEAGKTTNIQRLSTLIAIQRRGAQASPGTQGERTAFFDWLDFSGGFLDGRRVRCQLVSVPGQPELLHRRRYLLETADAIVFVADSRSGEVDNARRNLEVTRRIVDGLDTPVPVGVIVQANKQDLPDAVTVPALIQGMDLPPTVAVLASSAMTGDGVMQTFVLAARLATDRVRALIAVETEDDLVYAHETPAALYAAMEQLVADQPDVPATEPAAAAPAVIKVPEPETAAPHTGPARRRNVVPAERLTSIKAGIEISAGHLWPPVRGRALLANATGGETQVPEVVRPWAPPESFELVTTSGWVFHSAERWAFGQEAPARLALLALARQQIAWGDLVPETRALFLAGDADEWRLWVLSRGEATVREAFLAAVASRDGDAIRRVGAAVFEAVDRLREASPQVPWNCDLDHIALADGRGVVLALNEGKLPGNSPRPLAAQLHDLAVEVAAGDTDLLRWIEAQGVVR